MSFQQQGGRLVVHVIELQSEKNELRKDLNKRKTEKEN